MTILTEASAYDLYMGWFVLKRNDLKHLIDMEILKFRTTLFDWFDYRLNDKHLKSWQQDSLMGMKQLQTEPEWKSRLAEYGKRGYYSLENYQKSKNQIFLFTKLLRDFQNKDSEVIIMLMPEHSSLYRKIPEQALQTLIGALTQHLQNDEIPLILNYRQSIPDEGFTDISHLNKNGRETFTILLNELLGQKTTGL